MEFELVKESMTLAHLNTRTEKHGDEDVGAIDLKLSGHFPNAVLNKFSHGLRESLYHRGSNGPDLIDPHHLPELGHPLIAGFALDGDMSPARFAIFADGTNDEEHVFTDAKVKKIKLEPMEGGTVVLSFTVSISEPDPEVVAELFALQQQDLKINLCKQEQAQQELDVEQDQDAA